MGELRAVRLPSIADDLTRIDPQPVYRPATRREAETIMRRLNGSRGGAMHRAAALARESVQMAEEFARRMEGA